MTIAKLISRRVHNVPGRLKVAELFFEVPLDYTRPDAQKIRLFGRSVERLESSATGVAAGATPGKPEDVKPWLVYVQGGPGFGCAQPQDYSTQTDAVLDKGYQMLYLDNRGMGLSTPVTATTVLRQGDTPRQVDYLKHFRADSAVQDYEAVRKLLTAEYPEDKKKWSLMGQSYGGFLAICYVSKHPEGVREVFTAGGLPPVSQKNPDEVYRRLYRKVQERNEKYYGKFPEDEETIRRILRFLKDGGTTNESDSESKTPIKLPAGGTLSPERFMAMGIAFGFHGGLDVVHDVVLRTANDLETFGFLTRPTLSKIESQGSLDDHPIYAVLHEPLYCQDNTPSNWAADRLLSEFPQFNVQKALNSNNTTTTTPIFFTGEMIYKSFFTDYPELQALAPAAEALASTTDWPSLYDVDQLRLRNEVPVYAATYVDDMYVDFGFAQETAAAIKGCRAFVTNALYHDALRSKAGEMMKVLFGLKEDQID